MSDQVVGELHGIKPSQRKMLERTLSRRVPTDAVVTLELMQHLFDISDELHRRVGVLIDRRGHITHVVVGDAQRIYLPDLGRMRGGAARLRGVRFVQTQFGQVGLHRDDLTDLTKLRLDFVVTATRPHRSQINFKGAHLLPGAEKPLHEVSATHPDELVVGDFAEFITALETEYAGASEQKVRKAHPTKNRATLVAVGTKRADVESSALEMRELCATAGVTIVEEVQQVRSSLDPRYLIGRGKLEEIVLGALQHDAEMLIFDRELSPAQVRSIANETDLKVLDRTQLILDIFAQRAHSDDGKLQVELAQMKYSLPRLSEMSTAMSRLTGGIGGRGPGETKLEINRRRAKDRLNELEKRIDDLSGRRGLRRQQRGRKSLPTLAIVGYTNAGKSTLLNALTGSAVLAEDKLFATLDTTTRRLYLPSGVTVLVSDTVGFIRDLPEDLINAFRATLEELADADVLLHLVDASDPERDKKVAAVEGILADMELGKKPMVRVWNKADTLSEVALRALRGRHDIIVSARTGDGLNDLREGLGELFPAQPNAQGSDEAQ